MPSIPAKFFFLVFASFAVVLTNAIPSVADLKEKEEKLSFTY